MTEQEDINKKLCVSKVPIFNHLSYMEMQEISKTAIHRTYQKNEIVFHQGDWNDHLYIISKGKLKISRNHASGKEQLIRILKLGDFLGELSIFSQSQFEYEAVAMEDTELCVLNKQDVQGFLLKYPKIAIKFLEEISSRLSEAEHMLSRFSAEEVGTRLARYLLEQSEKAKGDVFSLGMTKRELASYLGTSPETISRRLKAFSKQNLIQEVDDTYLKIIDESRMNERLIK